MKKIPEISAANALAKAIEKLGEQTPRFNLRSPAAIEHLNVRREGEEEGLAVDIKLTFEKTDRVICSFFDPDLVRFLWIVKNPDQPNLIGSEMLAVKNMFLKPVSYLYEIHDCQVTIGSMEFYGCRAKNFTIQPLDGGRINLTCSVAVSPTKNEVASLADLLKDSPMCSIEEPGKLL